MVGTVLGFRGPGCWFHWKQLPRNVGSDSTWCVGVFGARRYAVFAGVAGSRAWALAGGLLQIILSDLFGPVRASEPERRYVGGLCLFRTGAASPRVPAKTSAPAGTRELRRQHGCVFYGGLQTDHVQFHVALLGPLLSQARNGIRPLSF